MFTSILESANEAAVANLSIQDTLLCSVVSLALGFVIALIYMYKGNYTKSFIVTLIILPAIVQAVIMVVNGNLGTGVAVMGAFSLIRFRSIPGTSKEIAAVFFSMAVGLATGMGYIGFAAAIVGVVGLTFLVLNMSRFGEKDKSYKELRITIPENLDYAEVFNDLFDLYAKKVELIKVRTTNLGSMYDLTYQIWQKDQSKEKEMIDALRCRNGNLTISCGRPQNAHVVEEL